MKKNKLSIDFVVLACPNDNESVVLDLLRFLKKNKNKNDKLYILWDGIEAPQQYHNHATVICNKLNHSYSEHRNSILHLLKKDYSFFLDADEKPAKELMRSIRDIILSNDYPDLLLLPRVNIVHGLTPEAVQQYGWDVTDGDIIQWASGDYQTRLFKNNIGLCWTGNLHERIYPSPSNTVYTLAKHPNNAIIHSKTIQQQLAGNARYQAQYTDAENRGQHI